MAYGGFLRQSTAVDILIGPFVDDTDGKTAETGLTIDVELSKNGQALGNKNDATAPVHDGTGDIDGYYNCELDDTDTNTVGQLVVVCFASGALPCRHEFQVLEEAIYDALYAASAAGFDANQRVNVGSWLSQAVTLSSNNKPDVNIDEISDDTTAPGNLELMFDGTGYAGGTARLKVDVDTIKTQAITCGAGVTVGAYVGNATAALGVDASGRVDVGSWLGTAAHAATVAGVPVVQLHASGGGGGINAPANFEDLNITDTTGLVRPDMANASGNYAGTVATVTTLTNTVTLANGAHGGAGATITLQTPIVANATQIEGGDATDALNAATPASVQNIPVDGSLPVALRNGAHGGAAATMQLGGAGGLTANITGNVTGTVSGVTPAAAGAQMDLVNAPNATALAVIAAALLDLANAIETGITLRSSQKLMVAALAGLLSGAATTEVTVQNPGGSKNRIVATVDADGNRSAVTLDVS